MLSEHFQQHKIEVIISEDDADLLIVEVAVELAREGWVVVVVSQDTDILVLLCHYMDDFCGPLIFESKTKKWDIRKLKQDIGSENNKEILFMHAFLGCDIVSQIYNCIEQIDYVLYRSAKYSMCLVINNYITDNRYYERR